MQVGDLTPSIELYERAVAEAVEAEAVLEELRFSVVLANVLIDRGDFARAEAVLARVIRITDESGDPIALARLYWSQSRLHSRRDEPRLAGRYARRALEILERTENETFVSLAYHLLATTEVEAGNGGEALRLLEYGREIRGGELGAVDEARFGALEARALMLAGRPADGARAADAGARVARGARARRPRAHVRRCWRRSSPPPATANGRGTCSRRRSTSSSRTGPRGRSRRRGSWPICSRRTGTRPARSRS